MTATTTSPDKTAEPADKTVEPAEPDARLCLKPRSDHRGMVDGAWWPRTRDLTRELPALIAALDRQAGWGPINHVTVNVRMWPDIRKKVRTGDRVVRVGWFGDEQDPHDICMLSLSRNGRWDLLVVPPELDPRAAVRLMVRASTPNTFQTASALVATASAQMTGPHTETEDLGTWESEGGGNTPPDADGLDADEAQNPHTLVGTRA